MMKQAWIIEQLQRCRVEMKTFRTDFSQLYMVIPIPMHDERKEGWFLTSLYTQALQVLFTIPKRYFHMLPQSQYQKNHY